MSNCPHCGAEALDERHWGCGTIQHLNFVDNGMVKAGPFLRDPMCRWRECAELLAELAEHPREGEEFIADYVELRARAMGAFRKLKEATK